LEKKYQKLRKVFVQHIQYIYLAGALAATTGAAYLHYFLFKALLGWVAISFWLVAAAYFINAGWIFRKHSDGSIPRYIRWLFIPIFLFIKSYHLWAIRKDSTPAIQKIDEQLFLGRRLLVSEIDKIEAKQIDAILDVTAEFGAPDWTLIEKKINYLNIPVLDHKPPSKDQLIQAVNWIHGHIKKDKNVMIHCALGRGRSVLVMAAYLLCRDPDLTVEEALLRINKIRPVARLNRRQLKLLKKIDRKKNLLLRNQAWIIANPASGGGKWETHGQEIIDTLSPYLDLEVKLTNPDKDAEEVTREAVAFGVDLVIACGGDGTISKAAGVLVHTQIAIAIVPFGTTNALSHVLWGIQSKLTPVQLACDIIIKGRQKRIDTGMCNGQIFLLIAGVGFEQQMIAYADRHKKDSLGQFAYIQGFFQAVARNKPLHLALRADNTPDREITATSLVAANAAPVSTVLAMGGGIPDYNDGLLNITWIEHTEGVADPALNLAELALAATGIGYQGENVRHIQARKLTITSRSTLEYALDGEPHTSKALDISILPSSLNILLPADEKTEELEQS